MLLLSEQNDTTSQLHVYPGTHNEISYDLYRSKKRNLNNKPIGINCNFGDLLLFDAGAMWHYGKYRDPRILLSIELTTGWLPTFREEKYDYDIIKFHLKDKPAYVKRMFDGFRSMKIRR